MTARIRLDRREVKQDSAEVRLDRREVRQDVKAGDVKEAKRDMRDLSSDKKDLRGDKKDVEEGPPRDPSRSSSGARFDRRLTFEFTRARS